MSLTVNSEDARLIDSAAANGSQIARPGDRAHLRHGAWWNRVKHLPLTDLMEGRFTRLFPDLAGARFAQADLEALADAMTAPQEDKPAPENKVDPEENPGIVSAYTYLGQFVDHDLTFDPTSHLRASLTKDQLRRLVEFRTPPAERHRQGEPGPSLLGDALLQHEPAHQRPGLPGRRRRPEGHRTEVSQCLPAGTLHAVHPEPAGRTVSGQDGAGEAACGCRGGSRGRGLDGG
jgi:hypothetical protein